jgi:hypothetical protein
VKKKILEAAKQRFQVQLSRDVQSKNTSTKTEILHSFKMTADSQNKDVEDPIKLKDEEKPSKFLRVITVSAYIFSVSFAALMLSLYYIFIWSKLNENEFGLVEYKLTLALNT